MNRDINLTPERWNTEQKEDRDLNVLNTVRKICDLAEEGYNIRTRLCTYTGKKGKDSARRKGRARDQVGARLNDEDIMDTYS